MAVKMQHVVGEYVRDVMDDGGDVRDQQHQAVPYIQEKPGGEQVHRG